MVPVLLHIPHSSTVIPETGLFEWLVDQDVLNEELLVMTDHFTDELFELEGADRLIFPFSRLVIDVERFRNDEEESMAQKGLGAIYVSRHNGEPLKVCHDREAALRKFYDPHHAALEEWTTKSIQEHSSCLIIDCHSFPSTPLKCDWHQEVPRPDFCIGADSFHTPEPLLEAALKVLEATGHSVNVNSPYAGSIVPSSRYGTDPSVASIMVEVNRKLYMDEATGECSQAFPAMKLELDSILFQIASSQDQT